MLSKVDHNELEIEEDLQWAERSWKIQRAGWVLLLLFVSSAAFGVFGNGLLSKVHRQQNEFTVDYERFGRYEMPQQIKIMAPSKDGKVALTIPQSFAELYEIHSITPHPQRQVFDQANITMEFAANAPVLLILEVEAEETGSHSIQFIINDQVFTISQFIYP